MHKCITLIKVLDPRGLCAAAIRRISLYNEPDSDIATGRNNVCRRDSCIPSAIHDYSSTLPCPHACPGSFTDGTCGPFLVAMTIALCVRNFVVYPPVYPLCVLQLRPRGSKFHLPAYGPTIVSTVDRILDEA